MSKEEKSESGTPIYRYDDIEPKSFQPAFGDEQTIELVSNHIEKHLGKIETVFHEVVSDLVHIDIHWVKPSTEFPFNILVTSGMSDLPMNVPDGLEEHKYVELCVLLPED